MSKVIELVKEITQKHNKQIALLKANQELIDGLADELTKAEINLVTFNLSYPEFDISFTGKKADLEKVWKALRQRGYKPASRPEPKQSSFGTWWHLEDTKEEDPLVIWMRFSSTECKVVKVGTKMVEESVYETQCDSELAELI